jgi:hypothetical protein
MNAARPDCSYKNAQLFGDKEKNDAQLFISVLVTRLATA